MLKNPGFAVLAHRRDTAPTDAQRAIGNNGFFGDFFHLEYSIAHLRGEGALTGAPLTGSIAAVCGLLLAPIALVDIGLWIVVLKALAALVLGGFGSIPGAILGGLLLGMIEQFSGVYMPDGFKDAAAYVVLIGVLIFWPRGLLGEAHGRRV